MNKTAETYRVCLFFGVQYSYILVLASNATESLTKALELHERALEASVWDGGVYLKLKAAPAH